MVIHDPNFEIFVDIVCGRTNDDDDDIVPLESWWPYVF